MCLKLGRGPKMSSTEDEDEDERQATTDDELNENLRSDKLPIVYRREYGVRFCGMQRLHPFDAAKGGNIYRLLKAGNLINSDSDVHKPREISIDELLDVHTKRYIESLKVMCGTFAGET